MFKRSATLMVFIAATALQFSACHKDKSAPGPTVKFLASTNSTVTGTTVTFSNQSTDATAYLWKFGDGSGSVSTDASHKYDSIGNFKVTLVAIGAGGTDSTSVYVTVKSGNITILDGVGIKATKFGTSLSTLLTQFGTDTLRASVYIPSVSKYLHDVYYRSLGVEYLFLTTSSVLTTTDVVYEIVVESPFTGTTQKGVAIGSPKGNALYYYGTPSKTTASKDGTSNIYSYYSYGLTFSVDIKSNQVEWIEIYPTSTNKSGRIIDDYSLFLPKNKLNLFR
jgi:PKD repeat protein